MGYLRFDYNAFLIKLKHLKKKFCQSIVDSKVQMDIQWTPVYSILIFILGAGSELPKDSPLQHDTTSLRARWSSTNLHLQTRPTTELAPD